MIIQQNKPLKAYNTFGIETTAEYFTELKHLDTLHEIAADETLPKRKVVLGGGSNILLTKPVTGLVIHNSLKGIFIKEENEQHVWVEVMAGEVWHEFVQYALTNHLSGIENLALIPGRVGAAPMQNIGAYGVEVKDTIDQVTAWHWAEKRFIVLRNEDCDFGYRESIFKHLLKDKVLITAVTFRLNKRPTLHLEYGAIQAQLETMGVSSPSIKSVAEAVMAIRRSKLPDPAMIGNAGSFFKNPTISKQQFDLLKAQFHDMPSYPVAHDQVKVPAGWLIEQLGWKGIRRHDAGVHVKQALVLVNYGKASGSEIQSLALEIIKSVQSKFDILLSMEVNIW
ncbi:MAG: UDP-N-acetylmuramate dehydrogenase [Bacteroidetes bacterium]|nr:UDP-N-acetylmuramate dehydrogenase [Bacteroidota bacterium]